MAVKLYALLAVLMFAGVVLPIAHAQLGTLVSTITGIVPCSLGNNISLPTTNVFPNASVQLTCGGNAIATTTTNSSGGFSFVIPSLLVSPVDLISKCNILVTTPLVSCNASLPTDGNLVSPLTFVNTTVSGIVRLAAVSFAFVRGLIG
ncbi:Pollen Ole e 1 allergen and extensin family protein [Rhynchospora pubera]|uniref:Pollen Ole e 1 allergen and extensin family protein n=1 Tax=Rhynchospora pubera TaxID=906938 RepID=A0AAV8DE19_9POAL|nr:Pollen Ole e 1 allergen and extensin family protein [Rhynchospora pubera]